MSDGIKLEGAELPKAEEAQRFVHQLDGRVELAADIGS